MKNTLIIAGILGIFVALGAHLFTINADAYHFGNIWFVGVIGGAVGIWGGNAVDKSYVLGALLLTISLILGFAGGGALYTAPAILQVVSLASMLLQPKEKEESFE
ncbi:hypothetical protein [Bacillus massilinigeriensis]|uniref:hypothetical protein n=1 Tax=Bacillus mediterraneensis TaxID=1805474 RepID=UPI0008F8DB1C|nr:hypothetical protein [Bacillus mediterraneensis]